MNTLDYWISKKGRDKTGKELTNDKLSSRIQKLMKDDEYTVYAVHVSGWRNGSRAIPVKVHRKLVEDISPLVAQELISSGKSGAAFVDPGKWLAQVMSP